jgi:CHRD domain/PEP-CTERM motif
MKSLKLLSAVLVLGAGVQASTITYVTTLSGANEIPANGSIATGTASITVDNVANTIIFNVLFSGLSSTDTAAHIHCCQPLGTNAGVATVMPSFPSFPLGVTSGSFNNQLFSLTDVAFYNPAFVTANGGTVASAEAALLAGMAAGQTYFNIHTSNNPGGEIRGQLAATPEPATFLLAGLALAGLVIGRRQLSSSR